MNRSLVLFLVVALIGSNWPLAQDADKNARSETTARTNRTYEFQIENGTANRIKEIVSDLIDGVQISVIDDNLKVTVHNDFPKQVDEDIRNLILAFYKILGRPPYPLMYSNLGVSSRVIRVYHVPAELISKALDQSVIGVTVKPVGTDSLIIFAGGVSQGANVDEMRRRVALLDSPPSKMSLQIWAFQMSNKHNENVKQASDTLSEIFYDFDDQIRRSFDAAWDYIVTVFGGHGKHNNILDNNLYHYLTYGVDCDLGKAYCLGYLVSENSYPSMAKILVALALTKEPRTHVDKLISAMEKLCDPSQQSINDQTCESPDITSESRMPNELSNDKNRWGMGPRFSNFKRALYRLYKDTRHRLVQAAVADFLFYYKWSVVNPHDFDSYGFSRSADHLNSLFAPVFEEFMRDLREHVNTFTEHPEWSKVTEGLPEDRGLDTGLRTSGVIRVSALSGTQATVGAQGASYFDVTQSSDLAMPMSKGGIQVLERLVAAMSVKPKVVEIMRGMRLTVRPMALADGSSADLDMDIQFGDSGTKDNLDVLDRVVTHTVNTKVRVEALRLFEVSTFLNRVTRPISDRPKGPVGRFWHAIFGGIPGLNRFFLTRSGSESVLHRSLVMVQAVIVPTALDLAWSLQFDSAGREKGAHKKYKTFHEYMRRCLILSPTLRCEDRYFRDGCGKLTYDKIVRPPNSINNRPCNTNNEQIR